MIFDRFANEYFLEKKKGYFENFKDVDSFYAGKELRLDALTLRLRLAFIHREFRVLAVSSVSPGNYQLTSVDGHNQKQDEVVKGYLE